MKNLNNSRAAVMVEFAIVMPLLILFSFGLVFGGRIVTERMWLRQGAYTTVLRGGISYRPEAVATMNAWSGSFVTWARETPSAVTRSNEMPAGSAPYTVKSRFSLNMPVVPGFYATTINEEIVGPSLTSQFGNNAGLPIGGGFVNVPTQAVPFYDCSGAEIGSCGTLTENATNPTTCPDVAISCNADPGTYLSQYFTQY